MADPTSTGLLGGLDPSLLLSLGAGLLSQRGPGANVGSGLLGGMQAYQANRAANQQYQSNQTAQQLQQIQLQRARMGQQILNGAFGGPQGGAQPPAAPPSPPPGIAAPVPSAVPQATQQILSGGWMPQQGQPQQAPKLQRPDITPLLAPTDPRLGMVDPEIYKAQEEGRKARIQQIYSTQVVPHAQNFADVATGSRPLSSLPADEQQLFRDTAGQMGVDLSTVNGQRMVGSALHSNWTQQFGNPPVPPKFELQTDQYGNQYDPITKANVHEEAPEKIVTPQHPEGINVPKSQSYGQTPWSNFTAGGQLWGQGPAPGQTVSAGQVAGLLPQGLMPRGNPAQQKAIIDATIAQAPAGSSAADIAGLIQSRKLSFGLSTKAAGAVGGQEGRLAIAENELEPGLQRVEKAIANVNPSDFKGANWLKNAVLSQASNPQLYELQSSMNALENTYKGIAGRYGSGVAERLGQGKLFNSNAGIPELRGMLSGVRSEAQIARQGVEGAKAQVTGAPPPLPPRPGQPQTQPLPAKPGAVTRSGSWTIERLN